ncbi:MAG: hypothetical protein RSD53_06580 [Algoriella sp.]|uniref:hypothetical protein n=1 Tax=Algoriella sp. TaxID=1872434 RepID=UPI002FCC4FDE
MYVDIIQQKTNKNVTIGVVKDYVVDILTNDFPKPMYVRYSILVDDNISYHIQHFCF